MLGYQNHYAIHYIVGLWEQTTEMRICGIACFIVLIQLFV